MEEQVHQFAKEVIKDDPAHSACPRLHEHGKSIQRKKYGDVDLVDGWLIVQDREIQNRPIPDVPIVPDPKTPPKCVKWKLREMHDCKKEQIWPTIF